MRIEKGSVPLDAVIVSVEVNNRSELTTTTVTFRPRVGTSPDGLILLADDDQTVRVEDQFTLDLLKRFTSGNYHTLMDVLLDGEG